MSLQVYKIEQAAKILGMCSKAVRRLITSKQLEAFRISARGDLRITEKMIQDYIEKNSTMKGITKC